jgi:hypothetical protein
MPRFTGIVEIHEYTLKSSRPETGEEEIVLVEPYQLGRGYSNNIACCRRCCFQGNCRQSRPRRRLFSDVVVQMMFVMPSLDRD